MREITIVFVDGTEKKIKVRGLTPKEIKKFKGDGHSFSMLHSQAELLAMSVDERKKLESDRVELQDLVLKKVLSKGDFADLDECENKYKLHAYTTCKDETWGSVEEEKNS